MWNLFSKLVTSIWNREAGKVKPPEEFLPVVGNLIDSLIPVSTIISKADIRLRPEWEESLERQILQACIEHLAEIWRPSHDSLNSLKPDNPFKALHRRTLLASRAYGETLNAYIEYRTLNISNQDMTDTFFIKRKDSQTSDNLTQKYTQALLVDLEDLRSQDTTTFRLLLRHTQVLPQGLYDIATSGCRVRRQPEDFMMSSYFSKIVEALTLLQEQGNGAVSVWDIDTEAFVYFVADYSSPNVYLECKAPGEGFDLSSSQIENLLGLGWKPPAGSSSSGGIQSKWNYFQTITTQTPKDRDAVATKVLKTLRDVYFEGRESDCELHVEFNKTPAEIPQKTEKVTTSRPRIPEKVRHEVWRRDQGKCVRCFSRERLEFDHIIPISKGGSNTTRNIELLCEKCNRSKGANI